MKISKTNEKHSLVARVLNLPANVLARAFWRFGRVNRYEYRNGLIIRHNSIFSSIKIPASDIQCWSVSHEMGFDLVRIEFFNREEVKWCDKYNDLLTILRKLLPTRDTR